MIPSNIKREHIIQALQEIDSKRIPSGRQSKKYVLNYKGKQYPPKYVLSLANKFANGEELDPLMFGGGPETNSFLRKLGFECIIISSLRKTDKSRATPKIDFNATQKRHNERCPKCKKTIERLLKEIYGNVENNYQFKTSTNVEDYKEYPFYKNLKEIYSELQNYRGHKKFVRTRALPHCDFYVPNPGFILEFDESQHFTSPRKIALQNYPQDIQVGFSSMKWIALCEEIKAKDNDPPFRDEQRAWYDTLRDFLVETKNMKPTIRLYSNEMQWCSLNPEKTEDVIKFREFIECRRRKTDSWIAMVILQSNERYSNDERLKVLSQIVHSVTTDMDGDGVILFPGGWFSADKRKANVLYERLEKNIQDILPQKERKIIVCLGIDGRKSEYAKDQIGIAISKKGIEAIGRKFHPAPQEKGYVELAKDYLSSENGKSRIFDLNGRKYFLCACYDSFGINQKKIHKFGIDIILDLVHGFYPKGEGGSGDVYFAKHGFAGASKQWDCLVFGAAVFFNRKIPENWPSGVYWNQGNRSTQKWRYEYNPIKPKVQYNSLIKEGIASVRIYNLDMM